MTRQEILDFVNNNPICFLATAEGNKPFVRAVMLHSANEDGLTMSTWKQKDLYQQIFSNPNVELCFYDSRQGKQLRIHGQIELINEDNLKKEILKRFKFLQFQADRVGIDSMVVFRLAQGQATTWSLSTAFEEKKYFTF